MKYCSEILDKVHTTMEKQYTLLSFLFHAFMDVKLQQPILRQKKQYLLLRTVQRQQRNAMRK